MLKVRDYDGTHIPICFDSDDLDFATNCQICNKEILLSGSDVYEEIRDSIEYNYRPDFNKHKCSAACRDIANAKALEEEKARIAALQKPGHKN